MSVTTRCVSSSNELNLRPPEFPFLLYTSFLNRVSNFCFRFFLEWIVYLSELIQFRHERFFFAGVVPSRLLAVGVRLQIGVASGNQQTFSEWKDLTAVLVGKGCDRQLTSNIIRSQQFDSSNINLSDDLREYGCMQRGLNSEVTVADTPIVNKFADSTAPAC